MDAQQRKGPGSGELKASAAPRPRSKSWTESFRCLHCASARADSQAQSARAWLSSLPESSSHWRA